MKCDLEYVAHMQNGILFGYKEKIGKWMDLECIILISEITQTQT